jgi:cytochrome P450
MSPAKLARTEFPSDEGLPLFGHVFAARRDLLGLLRRFHGHGSAVWTRAVGLRILCLLGPDATQLVLKNAGEAFSSKLGWAHFVEHVFPGAIMTMDGREHRVQRRIMQVAFTRRALREYVAAMGPRIASALDDWAEGERRIYPVLKELTLSVAASTFTGDVQDAAAINSAFVHAVEASIAILRVDLWPTPYFRGKRGRDYLFERFSRMLPDKRSGDAPDLFSEMCRAESEEGERFRDEEIVNHMIFLMMAAHDTATSAITTMVYLLAKNPEWQERLRASMPDQDHLDYDGLGALEELGWVLDEALRLYPPLAVIPRMTVAPVPFEDAVIPKGTLVGIAPVLNHHLPDLWTQPTAFDPERFSDARAEHKRHRYAFVPFGGGAHLCIGQHFATLEIKTVMHGLLRRFRWSIPEGYELPWQIMPIAKPKDGLPMQITRL